MSFQSPYKGRQFGLSRVIVACERICRPTRHPLSPPLGLLAATPEVSILNPRPGAYAARLEDCRRFAAGTGSVPSVERAIGRRMSHGSSDEPRTFVFAG